MDSYQAIYDAVRSKISGGNISDVIRDVAWQHFDISNYTVRLYQEFSVAAAEMLRPSVVYRPAISIDGDMWIALYGENLQDGVMGSGKSPDEAMRSFDAAWAEKLPARKTKEQIMALHDKTVEAIKAAP